jgi:hypothetical protein
MIVSQEMTMPSRREFLRRAATIGMGCASAHALAASDRPTAARDASESCFRTRGAVLVVNDMETYDWPTLAKAAGLTTLATHIRPTEIAAFVTTDLGQKFLDQCRQHGLEVEHELHALGDLLPRELFEKDKAMFRMDGKGSGCATTTCASTPCRHSRWRRRRRRITPGSCPRPRAGTSTGLTTACPCAGVRSVAGIRTATRH